MPTGVYKRSEKTKKLISKNHAKHQKGKKGEGTTSWKGINAKYNAKHDWVSTIKGRPQKCEVCGTNDKRRYEWANKDHKYSRNPDDYIRLCHRCHIKLDKALRVDSAKQRIKC